MGDCGCGKQPRWPAERATPKPEVAAAQDALKNGLALPPEDDGITWRGHRVAGRDV